MGQPPFDDIRIHVRFKLSALWASTLLCYLYGDFFGLYKPGMLQDLLAGRLGDTGTISQGLLVTLASIMAVPSAMVCLSLLLPTTLCRWANIVLGLAYTLLMAASMVDSWVYYHLLGVIEMAFTLTIAFLAWRWPRTGDRA